MGKRLEPLGDRIIVRVIKDPELSAGGVVLPEQARERSQRGEVLAVGVGRAEGGVWVPVPIEEGAVVLFSKYGGTELPEGGQQLLVLREADVLAIEHPEEDPKFSAAEAEPGAEFSAETAAHTGPELLSTLTEARLTWLAADWRLNSQHPAKLWVGSEEGLLLAQRVADGDGSVVAGLFVIERTGELPQEMWQASPAAGVGG